jgi:hypothetical protein
MDPDLGPPIWTPILDPGHGPNMYPQYGPPICTPNMDPHFEPLIWTPKKDPHYGPQIWTPIWDPQYGPPFWTPGPNMAPIWTPNMYPQYGIPIWTLIFGHCFSGVIQNNRIEHLYFSTSYLCFKLLLDTESCNPLLLTELLLASEVKSEPNEYVDDWAPVAAPRRNQTKIITGPLSSADLVDEDKNDKELILSLSCSLSSVESQKNLQQVINLFEVRNVPARYL